MGKIIKNGIEYASGSNVTVAKNIIYDNTSSGMESTNVQNAITELNNALIKTPYILNTEVDGSNPRQYYMVIGLYEVPYLDATTSFKAVTLNKTFNTERMIVLATANGDYNSKRCEVIVQTVSGNSLNIFVRADSGTTFTTEDTFYVNICVIGQLTE